MLVYVKQFVVYHAHEDMDGKFYSIYSFEQSWMLQEPEIEIRCVTVSLNVAGCPVVAVLETPY